MEGKKISPFTINGLDPTKDVKNKDPEDRLYILLLEEFNPEEDGERFWIKTIGRYFTLDMIITYLENIHIHNSLVLSETSTFMDALSVYQFFKYLESIGYDVKGVDIEEFNTGYELE